MVNCWNPRFKAQWALVWLTIVKPSGLHICRVGRHLMHLTHVVSCLVLELIV